jgi:hypothetical protein
MPEHGPVPEPMSWVDHDRYHEFELHRDRPAYRVPGPNDQRKYLINTTWWNEEKDGSPAIYQCGHGMCLRYVWCDKPEEYVGFANRDKPWARSS